MRGAGPGPGVGVADTGVSPSGPPAGEMRLLRPLRWWREVILIAAFYLLYSLVRDINGSNKEEVNQATHNADRVISLERHLHVFREAAVQHRFIHHRVFIEFWDGYYGTVHFVAVIAVLVVLFFRYPDRYRLWRNTLALTSGLALLGFAFFPLLPPRLLGAPYGFVDTLDSIGGLWNFDNETVSSVSNLYAAMPSLHTAWSAWCAVALLPVVRPAGPAPCCSSIPAGHGLLHRGHRQPLLRRRCRRAGHPRCLLPRGPSGHAA